MLDKKKATIWKERKENNKNRCKSNKYFLKMQ